MIVTEELKDELNNAAFATTQAYTTFPSLSPSKYNLLECCLQLNSCVALISFC